MKTPEELKESVKDAYGIIASQPRMINASTCCGSGCGCSDNPVMAEEYSHIPGYVPEADLGLGCGIPTEGTQIQPGQTVLDLGSGAGNDVFVARRLVGDSGLVIGVDFTEPMIRKAEANKRKLGFTNVDFRLGDIEQLPVNDASVDVVISNCVLNLVPDKRKAFSEIFRVLRSGGHFSISDIVVESPLPDALKEVAELYAGCVTGASPREEYLSLIATAGFHKIHILKEKRIMIPEEYVEKALGAGSAEAPGIFSITVTGEKP